MESRELLGALARLAEGADNLFYFFADCPLLDSGLASRMLENHRRYYADYTFADGYPLGLAVEILRPGALPALAALAKGCPEVQAADRGAVFEVVRKDINSFDVETELAPADLRLLRLSLSADTKRNLLLLTRLLEAGAADCGERLPPGSGKARSCCAPCRRSSRSRSWRAAPSFARYCPYPRFGIQRTGKQGEMELERFVGLADKIRDFSGDAVLERVAVGRARLLQPFPGAGRGRARAGPAPDRGDLRGGLGPGQPGADPGRRHSTGSSRWTRTAPSCTGRCAARVTRRRCGRSTCWPPASPPRCTSRRCA